MTGRQHPISVLVVEGSSDVRASLVHLLNSDPCFTVVGAYAATAAAIDHVLRCRPDVVLMDIRPPGMDGVEATRRIMETRPVPIVVCGAAVRSQDAATMFDSFAAGAVACVTTPPDREHPSFTEVSRHLLQTLKLMSEVKVIRRWAHLRNPSTRPLVPPKIAPSRKVKIVGIGASTGGPPVLQTILSAMPLDFPAPILIVQHIVRDFISNLADWLSQTTGARVHVAEQGIDPLPGHVYLAPDDHHMEIDSHGRISLNAAEPDNGLRPSVNHLFSSLADHCGPNAVGVLLTGMGRDGAEQLKRMKQRGAVTLAQDRSTSVVHGMAGEAISIGAVDWVLPPDQIAPALVAIAAQQPLAEGAVP